MGANLGAHGRENPSTYAVESLSAWVDEEAKS